MKSYSDNHVNAEQLNELKNLIADNSLFLSTKLDKISLILLVLYGILGFFALNLLAIDAFLISKFALN